ncbi:HEPN domain-containing protein [Fictibacillus fluitans]|uniref:ApeA N-terminal domain-containing protein n=1 Tax=Fictibacillus fluitans TaxID=3058422 RepID=A0ABT8HXJ4_9BACL|nr:HEPN domain-containing protein [Fictibacillus sp. NE201]MDN4525489.1 hypothetical protein [Fictibacillus sp. NE201]
MKMNFLATGFWNINELTLPHRGDLYLDAEGGEINLEIHIPNKGELLNFLELPLEIPFIKGSTSNGSQVTLVDCSRKSTSGRMGSVATLGYKAKYMLSGVAFEKKEDIVFSKMQIDIPGIIQWGNVSNYNIPESYIKDGLIELNILEPINIFTCDEYTVSYELICSHPFLSFMREEIVLKQMPSLLIESKVLKSLDWYIDVAVKMKRIIEIAMGTPLNFSSILAQSPKIIYEFENSQQKMRSIKVIHELTRKENMITALEEAISKHEFLFTLNELAEQGNFSHWHKISTKMEPIIELYIDDLYNRGLSYSRHFLNMAQALETYHSRFIFNGKLKDYKEQRVEVLISERPEGLKQRDREFLLGGSKFAITLRNRIADLTLANFRRPFFTGNIHLTDFPRIIANTRNYYTHYDQEQEKKALKGEELLYAYFYLRSILEYYLLIELGFGEDFAHKRMIKRIQPLKDSLVIQAENDRRFNKSEKQ